MCVIFFWYETYSHDPVGMMSYVELFNVWQLVICFHVFNLQLIVAVEPEEIPRLEALHERGLKNNVKDMKIVGPDEIREIEPHCRVSCSRDPLHDKDLGWVI